MDLPAAILYKYFDDLVHQTLFAMNQNTPDGDAINIHQSADKLWRTFFALDPHATINATTSWCARLTTISLAELTYVYLKFDPIPILSCIPTGVYSQTTFLKLILEVLTFPRL